MTSKPEIARVRVAAIKYAKDFLAQKYDKEYQELYIAYLTNRGITTFRTHKKIIDERELLIPKRKKINRIED